MGPGDVVRIRNVGEVEWKDLYGGTRYRVRPGGEGIIPFEAACLWFGHPDAVDIDPRNRYRSEEYARLRVRYGVYEVDALWDENKPKIEVFDLDGVRVITVIDDPLGETINPDTNDAAQTQLLQVKMTEMAKQMVAMQAQIDATARGDIAVANAGTITDDGPVLPSPVPVPALPKEELEGQDVTVVEDSPTGVRVKVSRAS